MAEYDLKKAVVKMGNKRFNFVLFKGKKANQVLITPKPAKEKDITPLEKDCGELTRLVKGVVQWENDKLTFATKKAVAANWEEITSKIFRANQCGTFLPVAFRQLGETETDEVQAIEMQGEEASAAVIPPAPADQTGTAPPSPPPPPPAPPAPAPTEQAQVAQPAAESPEQSQEQAAFAAHLAKLKPDVEKALAANNPLSQQIKLLLSQVGTHGRKREFVEAESLLDQIEALLKGGNAGADLKTAFADRLKAFVPKLSAAIGAKNPEAEGAKALATAANNLAKEGNFNDANAQLDRAEALLTKTPGQETSNADAARTEWLRLLAEYQPGYLEAVKRGGGISAEAEQIISKIEAAWQWAESQAAAGNFDKGAAALQKIAPLFGQALAAKAAGGGIKPGLVQQRKFLLKRWKEVPGQLRAQVAKLQQAIASNIPEEDADELASLINDHIEEFLDSLNDKINNAINEGNAKGLAALKSQVAGEQLFSHLLGNPFIDGKAFQSIVVDVIEEFEKNLAA